MIELDHQLLLFINGMHTDFLDSLMWLISGKLVWIPFYAATLYVVWRNRGWKGVCELLVLVGIMMLFTDMVNSQVIRPAFHRLRPANLDSPVGQLVHVVNDSHGNPYRGGSYGFPSAHAANYWGLSLLIYYFIRSRKVLYSMVMLTLTVCYSRSYLGVHYPGDLLAGIIYASLVVGTLTWIHDKNFHLSYRKDYSLTWLPGTATLATVAVFAAISLYRTLL